jgi:hypothetical protein
VADDFPNAAALAVLRAAGKNGGGALVPVEEAVFDTVFLTAGGTVGNTRRRTSPSRCSRRSVWVSIFCEMSGMPRFSSLNRRSPPDSSMTTSMLHLSPILSSTSRTGQSNRLPPASGRQLLNRAKASNVVIGYPKVRWRGKGAVFRSP